MRICFIVSEVFRGKRRGGFGKLVRVVGRELARRGFDVYVITWSEPGEGAYAEIDGMKVLSYPYTFATRSVFRHLIDYSKVVPLIKSVNADVYISIDCMVETYIAQKVMPRKKHVIWVQDPFDWRDYQLLGSIDPNYRISKLRFWATRELYARAYRRADLILTQARYYVQKVARLYRVDPSRIVYLPNPVDYIPDEDAIVKSEHPMVCFLGRMDPQKRYWIFFQLAKTFPDIEFVAIGRPSMLYEKLYRRIACKYQGVKNLRILGFVDEKKKSETLTKCWILCLPSIREGLPIAFLEALAHKCALLSSVDPDGIVTKFGYYVRDKDFAKGLKALLENHSWRKLGEAGYRYVKQHHQLNTVIDKLAKYLTEMSV